VQGRRVVKDGDREIWVKPLAGGGKALLLFNRGNQAVTIRATDEQLGVPANFKAKVRDLWGHKELKRWSGAIEAVVQPHDVQMYRIQP
jgi:alpha-galactosidase